MPSVVVIAANSFERFLDRSGAEIRFQLQTKTLHPAAIFNLSLLANQRVKTSHLKYGMKRVNPMAGYYLESFLKIRGWDVTTVFDWTNDEALVKAMSCDPVAVLFSTTYITNRQLLENCISALRGVIGSTPLLIGGPYIWKQKIELIKISQMLKCSVKDLMRTMIVKHGQGITNNHGDDALKADGFDTLADNVFSHAANTPLQDAIYIANEFGEHTALEVIRRIVSGTHQPLDLVDIPNLIIPAGDGSWYATETQSEPFDLDRDYTHWDLIDDMPDLVPLRTSVGCPHRCRYCDFIELHPTVIMRSPESILEEIRLIRARKRFAVSFIDDNIFLSKKRIQHLTRTLVENEAGIKWGGFFRVDCIDEENIEQLWESGCRWGLCGIESGDTEMLGLMRKGCRSDEISRGINLATGAGMHLKLTFIVGYPGETQESIDKSIAFINSLEKGQRGYAAYQVYPFYLLPSTAVDKPEFRAEYQLHGRFDKWSHSTMSFDEVVDVWAPYFFRGVDVMPYEYYVTDCLPSWSTDRRDRAFELRKKLTLAFMNGQDDNQIQNHFAALYRLLREGPAHSAPHWQEILADRKHQPGAGLISGWLHTPVSDSGQKESDTQNLEYSESP